MRLTLARRFSVAILGVVCLAAASSLLTLLSMWAVGNLMEEVLTNNVPSVRAANELEIALLRQGTILSTYALKRAVDPTPCGSCVAGKPSSTSG